MNKHVINLDLHGGDFAPGSVLEGATIALSKNPSIPLFWDSLANTAIKEFYFKQIDLSSDILKSIPNELFKCQDPLVNPLGKKIFWEIEWTEIQKKMS